MPPSNVTVNQFCYAILCRYANGLTRVQVSTTIFAPNASGIGVSAWPSMGEAFTVRCRMKYCR